MRNISVVIPVYQEENNLKLFYERLECASSQFPDFSWEYIFVNDGSSDKSLKVLSEIAASNYKVKVLDFSRNFGKEIALTAGVQAAKNDSADAVICMDADLQHPPELIPKLIKEWESGADIVATRRTGIDKQPVLRKIGSHLYYWVMAKISGLNMVSQTTDFRLYDKKVINAFCQTTERERMFRALMDWLGFEKVYVDFHADARNEGDASYSYKKLWHLAINSITSFSLWPLRLTGYLGVFISVSSGGLLIWMLLAQVFESMGFFTPLAIVVVANTFFIGIVLMSIGLVALYIGNIHTEVINRPLYVVRETINFKKNENDK